MGLIRTFCCFTLASCAALLLLPEGSLRRTASLAFGLMISLLWMDGLMHIELPSFPSAAPATVLTASGTSLEQASAGERQLQDASPSGQYGDILLSSDE